VASSSPSSGGSYGSCLLLAAGAGTTAGTTALTDYTDAAGEATVLEVVGLSDDPIALHASATVGNPLFCRVILPHATISRALVSLLGGDMCKPAVCVRSVGGACGVTNGGACGTDLLCTPVTAGHWEGPARCLDARAAPGAAARRLMVSAAIGVFSNRSNDDVCGGA